MKRILLLAAAVLLGAGVANAYIAEQSLGGTWKLKFFPQIGRASCRERV